jgi:hypothetical protein
MRMLINMTIPPTDLLLAGGGGANLLTLPGLGI